MLKSTHVEIVGVKPKSQIYKRHFELDNEFEFLLYENRTETIRANFIKKKFAFIINWKENYTSCSVGIEKTPLRFCFLFVTIESNKTADDERKSPTFDHAVVYVVQLIVWLRKVYVDHWHSRSKGGDDTVSLQRIIWWFHGKAQWQFGKNNSSMVSNSLLGNVILWESNQKYIRQMKRNDWRLDRK